jgi:O-methyltransferase
MVEDTIPDQAPQNIAILRLDTDWYASTKHELEHLWPHITPGGFLIIDDYGHFAGAKQAVDEFFGGKAFLFRIDYTGRLVMKT